MGRKSHSKLYVENTAIISKSDINSYLLTNENKWLEKIYLERLETNEKYNLGRENMVVTFVILSLHLFLKSSFYISIINLIPAMTTILNVVFLWLLYSASEPFPEGNNYFFLPGNPIRDCKANDSK
jgi:ABC-type tungstate transport system substrate-binding protein